MCRYSRALLPDKPNSFSAVESVNGYEYRVCRRALLSNVDHSEVNFERSQWAQKEAVPQACCGLRD